MHMEEGVRSTFDLQWSGSRASEICGPTNLWNLSNFYLTLSFLVYIALYVIQRNDSYNYCNFIFGLLVAVAGFVKRFLAWTKLQAVLGLSIFNSEILPRSKLRFDLKS